MSKSLLKECSVRNEANSVEKKQTKKHFIQPQFPNFNGPLTFGRINPPWVYVIAQGFPISVSLQLMTLNSSVWECFCLRPVIASLEQKYIKEKAKSNPTWYI